MPVVLGVDSSTQSTKVELRDVETGAPRGVGRAPHPATTPPRSEQDPNAWWEALETAATAAGVSNHDVACVAIAGQQHGLVVLDAAGTVVRPAKLWNDTESAPDAAWLVEQLGGPQTWADACGSVPVAAFTITKLSWLHRSEPDAWARLERVCLPHDWLTLQLTGSFVTDRGDASGTGYFDAAEDRYRFDLLGIVDRDLDWQQRVPRVLGPSETAGTTNAFGDGEVPVAAGTGDNMAAALGIGARRGDVVVSIGTSGTVFAVSDTPTRDATGAVAGFADATGRFLPLVCTLNATKVTGAIARLLGVDDNGLDNLALEAAAGADGVVLVPYFDGERVPNLPDATGHITGLRSDVTRAQLAARRVRRGRMRRARRHGCTFGRGHPDRWPARARRRRRELSGVRPGSRRPRGAAGARAGVGRARRDGRVRASGRDGSRCFHRRDHHGLGAGRRHVHRAARRRPRRNPRALCGSRPPIDRASLPIAASSVEAMTGPRSGDARAVDAMDVAGSILDLVGKTPLVRLSRLMAAEGLRCDLLAKVEINNPGGSVKDRVAIAMVDAAEAAGLLKPGGTIVEPTSGNTGAGLAIVAAQRGYHCIFVMSDKMSDEKIALLRSYGSEVVVCPTAVPPEDPRSYYSTAERLVRETPGAFRPDQYSNPANPLAHERTTGPEIWEQTRGRVTHFVAGIGTGGTITGVARALRAHKPEVQIIGADPSGSVYSGGTGRPYLVEGVGEDFWPTTFDPGLVDRVVEVSDAESFLMARRVTQEEGLLIGGSCGTAVHAALEVARDLGPDDVVVVLLPDSGRSYLSKIFDDEWMFDMGFLRADGPVVGDVLAGKRGDLPDLVLITPNERARDAIALMRDTGVSQLVVSVTKELPLAAKEVTGTVRELELMDQVYRDAAVLDRPVGEICDVGMPMIGIGEPVAHAVESLEQQSSLLVLDGGHPIGVLGRSDVLAFLAARTL